MFDSDWSKTREFIVIFPTHSFTNYYLKMGRMHTKGKGISSSALPYVRSAPAWVKSSPDEVVDQIVRLARKGMTPSQIGVLLRDTMGVPQVKSITGNSVLRLLKSKVSEPLGCFCNIHWSVFLNN
eukprot:NODE_101_length_19951_cov_0.932501.p19 type:complete len:125 gc:universal NODE_101_length_19951_cov_0.932501:12457-12083(-)